MTRCGTPADGMMGYGSTKWYGKEYQYMVWYGVPVHGTVRYTSTWYGTVYQHILRYGILVHGMVRYTSTWYGTVYQHMVRYGIPARVWQRIPVHHMVRCGIRVHRGRRGREESHRQRYLCVKEREVAFANKKNKNKKSDALSRHAFDAFRCS